MSTLPRVAERGPGLASRDPSALGLEGLDCLG
jgi:hypothetical protein